MSPEAREDKIAAMLGMPLDLHNTDEKYCLTEEDLKILQFFENRTVWTIGTAQSVGTYRNEMVNLACSVSTLKYLYLIVPSC